jgi:hypothetical protein
MRKYSFEEIDRMRDALAWILEYRYTPHTRIEDYLRTYMMNGTDPEELEEEARKAKERGFQ